MDRELHGESKDTWLRRAQADAGADGRAGGETAVRMLAAKPRDGWDPWEVWLRHIDQPRRHLSGRRPKLPG